MKDEIKRKFEKIFLTIMVLTALFFVILAFWISFYMSYQMFGSYDIAIKSLLIAVCFAVPIAILVIHFQEKRIKKKLKEA